MREEPKRKLKTLTSEPFLQINTTLITYFDFLIVYSRIQYFIQQPLSVSLSHISNRTTLSFELFHFFSILFFFFLGKRENGTIELRRRSVTFRPFQSNFICPFPLSTFSLFSKPPVFFCICIYFSTLIVVWCFFFFFFPFTALQKCMYLSLLSDTLVHIRTFPLKFVIMSLSTPLSLPCDWSPSASFLSPNHLFQC